MSTKRAKLLLHPVRMRVVIALMAQELTTNQIHELMPEVPQASLYRAISQLTSAGVLDVVSETPRGGALERTYCLAPDESSLTPEDFASTSPAEIMGAVHVLADRAVADTSRFLAHAGDAWGETSLTVRYASMWLTDEESAQMRSELLDIFERYQNKERGPESRHHSLQAIVMPGVPVSRAEATVSQDQPPATEADSH